MLSSVILLLLLGTGWFGCQVEGAEGEGSEAELAHFRRLVKVRPEDIQANMHYQDLMLKSNRRRGRYLTNI